MGIFDFLKSSQYADPTLGSLGRKGGYWRGQIRLGPDGEAPLLLAGGRGAPDQANVELARALVSKYIALRPAIERSLFEHYEPYAEAGASGSADVQEGIPRLSGSGQVWNHVSLVRVLIEPLGGTETVEIAYRTEWDTEHTLGARFQNWVLVESNGSVI